MKINQVEVLDSNGEGMFNFRTGASPSMRALQAHLNSDGDIKYSLYRIRQNGSAVHIKTRHAAGEDSDKLFVVALQIKGNYQLRVKGDAGDKVRFKASVRKMFGEDKVRTQVEYRDRLQATSSTNTVEVIKEVLVPVETVRTEYIYLPSVISSGNTPTAPSLSETPSSNPPITPADDTLINIPGSGLVNITITDLSSEALFNNTGGVYQVLNSAGDVQDPLTGATVSVGVVGYKDAVLRLSQTEGKGISFNVRGTEDIVTSLTGSKLYATFLVANGTVLDAQTNGAEVYTQLGAGAGNVRKSGNTFSYEDSPLGVATSHVDFNDAVFSVKTAVTA